jgi:hypothetical protein
MLQCFDFKWPTQLPFIEDSMTPTIIDFSLGFTSRKANKLQKKEKVNQGSADEISS